MPVRIVVQHGPRDKKVAAFAIDWPGWSRGAKIAEAAIETLEAYRARYRPVAALAGLEAEFDEAGDLEIVEDHVGTGSTDFWAISFAASSFETGPMAPEELDRKLALLEAAWRFFDETGARVSAAMQKGPRGGGRDRDEIIAHVLRNEQGDFARRVGVPEPAEVMVDPAAVREHRAAFLAGIRERNVPGAMAGRNWTIPFLVRHTAFHALDHAWEMEDKDLQ